MHGYICFCLLLEFILISRHFVEILNAVRISNFCQKKTLLIQRNDYMCHEDSHGNRSLKQVYSVKKHLINLFIVLVFDLVAVGKV